MLAVLDQPTRQAIDLSPAHADYDIGAISDMTVALGRLHHGLKTWITNGTMDN